MVKSKDVYKKKTGFTFIEILIIVTIISISALSIFITNNPTKKLKKAKDTQRTIDIKSILTAVHKYIVENNGSLPTGLTSGMAEKQLGTVTTGCALTTGGCNSAADDCVNLTTPLVKYLKTIPFDPDVVGVGGSASLSNYNIVVDSNGIVTIKACNAEGGINISVSR